MRTLPPVDPKLIQYREAPWFGLEAAALALMLALLLAGVARGAVPVPAVVTPEGRQTTSALIENPPMGRLNYEANAMGPTTLRENFSVDSTRLCYANGATIIRLWIYMTALSDTAAPVLADSAKIVWLGLRPKAHTVSLPDSGSAATHLYIRGQARINGGMAYLADTTGMRWTEAGAAQTTWNRDIWARALPGEILVPISKPSTIGAGGTGLSAWRTVDLCVPEGCFSSPIFTVVARVFGHSISFPVAGTTWAVDKNPRSRYQIRLDAECIR